MPHVAPPYFKAHQYDWKPERDVYYKSPDGTKKDRRIGEHDALRESYDLDWKYIDAFLDSKSIVYPEWMIGKRDKITPFQRLALSMLLLALEDIRGDEVYERNSAERWIRNKRDAIGCLSFSSCCAMLKLDDDAVRRRLMEILREVEKGEGSE